MVTRKVHHVYTPIAALVILAAASYAFAYQTDQGEAPWSKYINERYDFSFEYLGKVLSEREGIDATESDILTVRYDFASDPISICVALNTARRTAKGVFNAWQADPPQKSHGPFSCGDDYPDYAEIHSTELEIGSLRAYEVTSIRGKSEDGAYVSICTYFAGRLAISVCYPGDDNTDAAFQYGVTTYRHIVSSLNIVE